MAPLSPRNEADPASHTSPGRLTAWRNAVFAVFSLSGLSLASWVARIPTVRDLLTASTFQMGVLIFGLAAGSIIGLTIASRVISRIAARGTIVLALTFASIGLAVAGFGAAAVADFALTFAGLAIFGLGMGLCDVAMNVSGAANERMLRRTIMPTYHAFFSIGTVAGAGLGALAELVHLSVAIHMGVIAVTVLIAIMVASRHIQSEERQHTQSEERQQTSPAKSGKPTDTPPVARQSKQPSVWRDPQTLLIGIVVLGMAFAEGSANDWLTLAMVDGHGVSHTAGAVVFGVFVASMTVGRLVGGRLLDRFGRVAVLRASASLAGVGLLIVIFIPNAVVASVATVLWGLGTALGFPVGISAAADEPRLAAVRVSVVSTIGYCAFLVGPPVIGFLGEHFGLLHALLLVVILIITTGLTAGATRENARFA